MRAVDLYCFGCCFLLIKFQLIDLWRFIDTIISFSTLMNDNIEERISVKTKDLIKEIKETLILPR